LYGSCLFTLILDKVQSGPNHASRQLIAGEVSMASYWQDIASLRMTRRRTLAASGGAALGTALLAACGGGSDSGSGGGRKGEASKLVARVEDTTKDAKPGGLWIKPLSADILNLDPYGVTIGSAHAPWGYSRLVLYKPARYPDLPTGEVT